MTEVCTVRPYLRQGSGGAVYGEERTYPCRLEKAEHLIYPRLGVQGAQQAAPSRARLFVRAEPQDFRAKSRVMVDGEEYFVQDTEAMRGFGLHHLEVILQ
ncbi:MAG: hypothetical protein IJ083_02970 [Clostridia bacterium]|nr:hypothetical protein [Clostridia bacterium]